MTKTYPKEISTCFHCFRAERGDPCGMSRVGRAHGDGRRVRPSRCRVYIFLKSFLIWRSSPAAWPPAALEPHLRPLWQSPRKDSSSRCRFPWGGIWIGSPFENLSSIGTFYQVLRPGCHTLMMIMISGHDGSQHPAPPSHQLARHQALLTDPQVFDILIIMIILQFGLSSSCDSPW